MTNKIATWNEFEQTEAWTNGINNWKSLWDLCEKLNGERVIKRDGANLNTWAAIGLLKSEMDDNIGDLCEIIEQLKKKIKDNQH